MPNEKPNTELAKYEDVKLAKYDRMCEAIEAASRVDEVRQIHDQAVMWAAYAKQAKNWKPTATRD